MNARGWNSERGRGADHDFLEATDVVGGAQVATAQVEDGVGDELAGAVVGDVTATVGFDDLGIARRHDEVLGADAAAEAVDRRVLQEGDGLGRAFPHGGRGGALPVPGVAVGDHAEAVETNPSCHTAGV